MKRIRKGKKKLILILLITLLTISAIILTINIINKKKKETELPENPTITELPETTYSDMKVNNIAMELRKGNTSSGGDETVITFDVHNTTNQKVEAQFFNVILLDSNNNIIGKKMTYITEKEVGEVQQEHVAYKGDLTATTQIKLEKVENSKK